MQQEAEEEEKNSDDVDMDKLWEKLREQEISKASSIVKENAIENKVDTDKVDKVVEIS